MNAREAMQAEVARMCARRGIKPENVPRVIFLEEPTPPPFDLVFRDVAVFFPLPMRSRYWERRAAYWRRRR